MAKNEQSGGIKSALELAMERMKKTDGEIVPLTDAQKAEIARVEAEAKAKTAEVEIMTRERITAAYRAGDAEGARKLEEQMAGDLERIRDRAAAKKRKVRDQ